MDSTSEVAKVTTTPKEKSVLDISKLISALDSRNTSEPQQSVLRKSPVGVQNSQNLIKLLPKSIPLKTLQGPNGNIIVHGPHNKLLSLQLKQGNTQNAPATSTISLLPITIPKDVKAGNKIPALALIGSNSKGTSKNVVITKDMLPPLTQSSASSLLTSKMKDVTVSVTSATSSSNNKAKGKDTITGHMLNAALHSQTSLLSAKTKDTSNSSGSAQTASNNSLLLTKAKDTPTTVSSANSVLAIRSKDTSTNNGIMSVTSIYGNTISVAPKEKEVSSGNATNTITVSSSNSNLILKQKGCADISATIASITCKNSVLSTKTFKDISISKTTTSQAGSQGLSLAAKLKEHCASKSTSPVTPTSAFTSTKSLEIKPITVTNSPKALTPAQAATVPIPSSKISSHFSLSKNIQPKSDNGEAVSPVTIEKRNCKSNLQLAFNKDLIQTAANSSLISKPSAVANSKNLPVPHITKVTPSNSQPKEEVKKLPVAENVQTPKNAAESQKLRGQNIETLIPCFNKQKVRQQSLLKNKTIERLKRSPRTKSRSKSLTSITVKNGQKRGKIGRKLSTCSDSEVKKSTRPPLRESLIKAVTGTTPPKPDNSLLCHEKMEISPTNSSVQTSSESLSTSNTPSEQQDMATDIKPEIAKEPENILPDNHHVEDIKPPLAKPKPVEVLSLLNWKNGLGLTTDCKLNFQLNEFGLIEVTEDALNKYRSETIYDKPIYERESKSQNTSDYSDPLYYCKGCNCRGAAVDFLFPEFCSHECIQRYNFRCINDLPVKLATKKYVNRRKDMEKNKELMGNIPKKPFNWTYYLNARKEEPAPIDLFPNPFPCGPNLFKIGMKLEAIDPEHSNLFCVCTIVDKRGYRLKLHFDGYLKKYEFWVNADSMDIFPPGWCSKTNRTLQPPKGMNQITFNWPMYLIKTKSAPAPRNLFTHLNSSSTTNPFQVGMKLEADDLRNTRKVCVASVADVLDNRILVHFDGWDESYDYWIDINSPYIHPINWHQRNGFSIVPPPDWKNVFDWKIYLAVTQCTPATDELFSTRDPIAFGVGMKLEVVDKKNLSLIRPATVIMADEYEIKVLFDGWHEKYAFWVVDDSPDIHPVGWCEATGHELEAPPNFESLRIRMPCPIVGCRGIGNAIRTEIDFHASADSCPYDINNWNTEHDGSQRLEKEEPNEPDDDLKPNSKRKCEEKIICVPTKTPKIEPTSENDTDSPQKAVENQINISHQLLCDYGPRLQFVHNLWMKNSECLTKHLTEPIVKNPMEWSVDEVAEYISKLPRCQIPSEALRKEEIDGAALLSMRQNDLTDLMNIHLGPAIKIYNQIVQLREEVATNFTSNSLSPSPSPRTC